MNPTYEGGKPTAAVALVVTRKNPSILLVRRAERSEDPWSGQWAFPGGRMDDNDSDLIATCQREVLEECGCDLSTGNFIRALPTSFAGRKNRHPLIVAPFLWEMPTTIELIPDKNEVVSAHWQELSYLLDQHNHTSGRIAPKYADEEFPYVMLDNTPLWGFTYRVLMDYLQGN